MIHIVSQTFPSPQRRPPLLALPSQVLETSFMTFAISTPSHLIPSPSDYDPKSPTLSPPIQKPKLWEALTYFGGHCS